MTQRSTAATIDLVGVERMLIDVVEAANGDGDIGVLSGDFAEPWCAQPQVGLNE